MSQSDKMDPKALTYSGSGVDKEKGYEVVSSISRAQRSRRPDPNILGGIGGFSALYRLSGYRKPVLVSATDGVGTKLQLALEWQQYRSAAQDCVAMCVNDLICCGARPLFFLDYLASNRIDVTVSSELILGIDAVCREYGISLIGGETAEMPGFYQGDLCDLAGFCVGAVEEDEILRTGSVREGDALIGLGSSGLHSNGFSLVRRFLSCLEEHALESGAFVSYRAEMSEQKSFIEALLEPTRIYLPILRKLLDSEWSGRIRSAAHITGGGLYENLPRVLPEELGGLVSREAVGSLAPRIFQLLKDPMEFAGNLFSKPVAPIAGLDPEEMWQTFNMGVGLVIVASPEVSSGLLELCAQEPIPAAVIGRVVPARNSVRLCLE